MSRLQRAARILCEELRRYGVTPDAIDHLIIAVEEAIEAETNAD
jgi:hypothetical protein